jgi:phosphoglycerol transferase MdoB-like AlkP superfamily enzyme
MSKKSHQILDVLLSFALFPFSIFTGYFLVVLTVAMCDEPEKVARAGHWLNWAAYDSFNRFRATVYLMVCFSLTLLLVYVHVFKWKKTPSRSLESKG